MCVRHVTVVLAISYAHLVHQIVASIVAINSRSKWYNYVRIVMLVLYYLHWWRSGPTDRMLYQINEPNMVVCHKTVADVSGEWVGGWGLLEINNVRNSQRWGMLPPQWLEIWRILLCCMFKTIVLNPQLIVCLFWRSVNCYDNWVKIFKCFFQNSQHELRNSLPSSGLIRQKPNDKLFACKINSPRHEGTGKH